MNGQFAFIFIHLYTQTLLTTVVFYIFNFYNAWTLQLAVVSGSVIS